MLDVFHVSASARLRAVRIALPPALFFASLCAIPACKRQRTADGPVEPIKPQASANLNAPARSASAAPAPASPQAAKSSLLTKLHHAAQEMALDGFQFDKKALGWPHDAGMKSAARFLDLLVKNNYLTADDAVAASGLAISNLSDADPGETAFLRSSPGASPIVVVRKDGRIESFADPAAGDAFAPPPPRQPSWLP